jgi:hypothetical protein
VARFWRENVWKGQSSVAVSTSSTSSHAWLRGTIVIGVFRCGWCVSVQMPWYSLRTSLNEAQSNMTSCLCQALNTKVHLATVLLTQITSFPLRKRAVTLSGTWLYLPGCPQLCICGQSFYLTGRDNGHKCRVGGSLRDHTSECSTLCWWRLTCPFLQSRRGNCLTSPP